jgi:glucokinase
MAKELQADTLWLIADVGATSSRCALCRATDRRPTELEVVQNDDFPSLKDLFDQYVSRRDVRPEAGAIAIAAPINGDDVQMTNRDWRFNRLELAERLELARLDIINDFHAVAHALPNIGSKDRVEIGQSRAYRQGTRAALGPGSGLGVGAWIAEGGSGVAMRGEGGHVTLPARDEAEERIITRLRERYGHCSAERVLSGPGIIALHSAMHGDEMKTSREITNGTVDRRCRATMEQFYRFLGSVSADLALTTGAYGGIYIAGGIVPDHIDQIQASTFRERFEDKNRYRGYMQAIPTYVITDPTPGLSGMLAYIRRQTAEPTAASR